MLYCFLIGQFILLAAGIMFAKCYQKRLDIHFMLEGSMYSEPMTYHIIVRLDRTKNHEHWGLHLIYNLKMICAIKIKFNE